MPIDQPPLPPPLTAIECDAIAARALGDDRDGPVVIAVSGGVDSMALLHCCGRAAAGRPRGRVVVATVDHRLRAASAEDAGFVAAGAAALGLDHEVLVWSEDKPTTGIQAAARHARYGLLVGLCARRWPSERARIVTAHTRDDQAETVIMRLARGSGVDGLAGIAPTSPCHIAPVPVIDPGTQFHAPTLVRPLLAVPKARLMATMTAWGQTWREDPTNASDTSERVRIRRAVATLYDVGVSVEAIARSARRLNDVRDALAEATDRLLADPRLVHFDRLGFVDISRSGWDGQQTIDRLVRTRALAAIIRAVGGLDRPVSLAALERLQAGLERSCRGEMPATPFATTIGRTRIALNRDSVRVVREIGRAMPTPSPVNPGTGQIWDNRFRIHVAPTAPLRLMVAPLGRDGIEALTAFGADLAGVPRDALVAVPSFWVDGMLVAVPSLAHVASLTATMPLAGVDRAQWLAMGVIEVEPIWPSNTGDAARHPD